MTGAFGRNHDHIHILGRLDTAEMDVEAVGEGQGLSFGQIGLDGFLVKSRLLFIVDEDHDDVGNLCRLGAGHDLHSLSFGLCPALGAFVKTDDHIHAAVFQVQSVGVTLGAVTDNRNGFAFELLQIAILLIENPCHSIYLFLSFFILGTSKNLCTSETGFCPGSWLEKLETHRVSRRFGARFLGTTAHHRTYLEYLEALSYQKFTV